MAADRAKSNYQKLLEKHASPQPAAKSAQESLDELLTGRGASPASPASAGPVEPDRRSLPPMEQLRHLFREQLIPLFEELKAKYQQHGIGMSLDAATFLSGGRQVVIEFHMPPRSIKLEGTAIGEGIAFNEIHSYGGVPGAISSGPMLRTRLLTAERFRDFICAQLAPLVRDKLRQK